MTNTGAGGGEWYGSEPPKGDGGATPKEMAKDAVQTVKQEAASFAADAKEKAAQKASDTVEQHKETATRTLGDFADAIRKAGEELSAKDQSMAGKVIAQAADGLESFSRSVSDKRPEELLEAVRDFGRKNPTAFVAGSVLVGLALGRFLKSSGAHEGFGGVAGFGSPAPGGAPAYGQGSDPTATMGDTTDVADAGATSIGVTANELDGDDRDLARFDRERSGGGGTGV
jgi:hypothetical protein